MNVFSPVSKAEFLRFISTRRDERYEFEGGLIVQQMTGGTRRHGEIALRISLAFVAQLDRSQYAVTLERGVETADSIRFTDVVVEPASEPDDSVTTKKPVIIVEVLSPSTKAYDLRVKPSEYLALPSLDAYVVASQTEAALQVWKRNAAGIFDARPVEIEGPSGKLNLKGRGYDVTVKLSEIYAGIVGA